MRRGDVTRKTYETEIAVQLSLDGAGRSGVDSGIGFLDHMLANFARHGSFDLNLRCKGDTRVDNHHTAEDIGICLGEAFAKAIGVARGIRRFGHIILPMDETLIMCAVDISGRSDLGFDVMTPVNHKAGAFDTELLEEFLRAFVRNAGITVHLRLLDGKNTHHIIEACFKALARALRSAVSIDDEHSSEIPSTKGRLL